MNNAPQDLQIFQTNISGQDSNAFNYTYIGNGNFTSFNQTVLALQNSLFVATKKNPFPDFTSNTLYLQWMADGQLCNQTEIDGHDSNNYLYICTIITSMSFVILANLLLMKGYYTY